MSKGRSIPRALFALSLGVALPLGGVTGCGDSAPAQSPHRELPPYVGPSVTLFDDGIEARAFGSDLEKQDPQVADQIRRQRLAKADAVVRVRVVTVTTKEENKGQSYELGFKTAARIGGAVPQPEEFVVVAGQSSPSLGILKSFESRLIGTPFIAYIASFSRADGEQELHFHLSPDTNEELAAIKSAAVLSEFAPTQSK